MYDMSHDSMTEMEEYTSENLFRIFISKTASSKVIQSVQSLYASQYVLITKTCILTPSVLSVIVAVDHVTYRTSLPRLHFNPFCL